MKLLLEKKWREYLMELKRNEFISTARKDGDFIDHENRKENEIENESLSFEGIKGDTAFFTIEGYSHPQDGPYTVRVKFLNYYDVLGDDETYPDSRSKAEALVRQGNNDYKMDCTCKSFRYHYRYVANLKNGSIEPENRPANITNPLNRGIVCKHARVVSEVFPLYVASFIKYIKDAKNI